MQNQMEKNMENDITIGEHWEFIGDYGVDT